MVVQSVTNIVSGSAAGSFFHPYLTDSSWIRTKGIAKVVHFPEIHAAVIAPAGIDRTQGTIQISFIIDTGNMLIQASAEIGNVLAPVVNTGRNKKGKSGFLEFFGSKDNGRLAGNASPR
ncbi:MAG: hypothetical protein U5N56_06580 [Candidatus Marinimicrobia bacterium]|nr:hypothetical protein [Candidatus Neomarinimicrobiota bacterium]